MRSVKLTNTNKNILIGVGLLVLMIGMAYFFIAKKNNIRENMTGLEKDLDENELTIHTIPIDKIEEDIDSSSYKLFIASPQRLVNQEILKEIKSKFEKEFWESEKKNETNLMFHKNNNLSNKNLFIGKFNYDTPEHRYNIFYVVNEGKKVQNIDFETLPEKSKVISQSIATGKPELLETNSDGLLKIIMNQYKDNMVPPELVGVNPYDDEGLNEDNMVPP
jgi:hypothetical protein